MSQSTSPVAIQKRYFPREFAWGLLNPFSDLSVAVRLGEVAQTLLSRWPVKPLSPKPRSEWHYLTMTNRAHWLLLRESLLSLHRAWQTLPQLTVVSDGSWKKEEFLEAFQFWPEPIRILTPEDITKSLADAGQTALVELSKHHPLGLKLAAIVLQARQQPILFVDSDILWFSDPREMLVSCRKCQGPCATVETGCSYNEPMMRRFCPEGLMLPAVNSGCVYLSGELCAEELLQSLLAAALEHPKHNFNEQSIIAVAVQKNGCKLPPQFCMVDFTDALTFKRRKPWREGYHARHYVNWMRHQFYRDALTLRRRGLVKS